MSLVKLSQIVKRYRVVAGQKSACKNVWAPVRLRLIGPSNPVADFAATGRTLAHAVGEIQGQIKISNWNADQPFETYSF